MTIMMIIQTTTMMLRRRGSKRSKIALVTSHHQCFKKKMNQHKFLRFIFSVKLPISTLQESAFPPHFPHRSNFFLEYIK